MFLFVACLTSWRRRRRVDVSVVVARRRVAGATDLVAGAADHRHPARRRAHSLNCQGRRR